MIQSKALRFAHFHTIWFLKFRGTDAPELLVNNRQTIENLVHRTNYADTITAKDTALPGMLVHLQWEDNQNDLYLKKKSVQKNLWNMPHYYIGKRCRLTKTFSLMQRFCHIQKIILRDFCSASENAITECHLILLGKLLKSFSDIRL